MNSLLLSNARLSGRNRMLLHDRRQWMAGNLGAAAAMLLARDGSAEAENLASGQGRLSVAPFRFDVTPPQGHSLCGGWIKPVVGVDDPLEAIGFVLRGAGRPIVVCAVDWTGLLNSAHLAWRTTLADAAGTTPDRVAVQCVHQHNAPFACLDAQKLLAPHPELPSIVEVTYFDECLRRARRAIAAALPKARAVSHLGTSSAKVLQVASNRRFVGPDGKIQFWRGSATKDAKLQELPEGLIDPWLKTLTLYDGDKPVVACHYYATHPMSYYGDGRVTSEFVGLARKQRQAEDPDTTQLYFTGCSGNIAAGKYNDGTPEARRRLTDRMVDALRASSREIRREPLTQVVWRSVELRLDPNPVFDEATLAAQIADKSLPPVGRLRPAFALAWIRRCQAGIPILLSSLSLNQAAAVHLPAESFLEYQLRLQELFPQRFLATAAYGDGGPWYIPTRDAYPQGGYEVSVAFSAPTSDKHISHGLPEVIGS